MGAGEWFVGGDIRYEGSKYAQVHNFAETGSRTTVGAQAGYRTDRWAVTVWGKNLTDDDTAMDILRYVDSCRRSAGYPLRYRRQSGSYPRP